MNNVNQNLFPEEHCSSIGFPPSSWYLRSLERHEITVELRNGDKYNLFMKRQSREREKGTSCPGDFWKKLFTVG